MAKICEQIELMASRHNGHRNDILSSDHNGSKYCSQHKLRDDHSRWTHGNNHGFSHGFRIRWNGNTNADRCISDDDLLRSDRTEYLHDLYFFSKLVIQLEFRGQFLIIFEQ